MSTSSSQESLPVAPPRPLQGDGVVHEIQWSDALPWWLLFRAAGHAFAPTVILLAALGALATWGGWSLCDRLDLFAGKTLAAVSTPAATSLSATGISDPALQEWLVRWLPGPAATLMQLVAVPFRPSATLAEMAGALVRIAWFVAVWSIFGTAIARCVGLKLAGEEAPGLSGALWFGSRKWLAAFNSVAFVLAGILALSVPGAILGLLMRSDWGLAFAGAIWPLVLAGAVVLSILAVGVVAGWPLMVGAVGVERGDSFQAISTAFSYLYQRPLHYIFYGLIALAVSLPALAAASLFATATSTLALWAASLGMGHDRTVAVLDGLHAAGGAAPWGIQALGFWTRGLEAILGSFGWGYFWAIATAAYMLLRRDVDGTELDEVVVDELPGESA